MSTTPNTLEINDIVDTLRQRLGADDDPDRAQPAPQPAGAWQDAQPATSPPRGHARPGRIHTPAWLGALSTHVTRAARRRDVQVPAAAALAAAGVGILLHRR